MQAVRGDVFSSIKFEKIKGRDKEGMCIFFDHLLGILVPGNQESVIIRRVSTFRWIIEPDKNDQDIFIVLPDVAYYIFQAGNIAAKLFFECIFSCNIA